MGELRGKSARELFAADYEWPRGRGRAFELDDGQFVWCVERRHGGRARSGVASCQVDAEWAMDDAAAALGIE